MSDDYGYWAAKLAGHDPDPIEPRTTMPLGFWRRRDGRPMAVWMDGDERVALVGWAGSDEFLPPHAMEAIAERGGFGTAITEDFYREAIRKGYWPDSEGPARDLMEALRDACGDFTSAANQIAEKLALYPDYRITKKLGAEIIKAIATVGGALNTYQEKTHDERREDRAA